MGFRIPNYEDAKALGLEHLWAGCSPKIAIPEAAPPPSQFVSDGMNKLERAFWERLQGVGYQFAAREPLKFKLAGKTFYTPDFVAYDERKGAYAFMAWEVKGFMREDAAVKIKVAATIYPWIMFILVTREKRAWQCRYVNDRGISREVWCPDWLR